MKGCKSVGVRKKSRANNLGSQWWRKLALPRRGRKDSLLCPAELTESQKLRLREREIMLLKSISVPRTTRRKHLAVADWDETTGTAIVQKACGKILHSMGYFKNSKQHLLPEEALFLVDKGSLELHLNGLPMSVQRTWTTCMHTNDSLTLEEYLAYSYLRRAGYVVRRCTNFEAGDDIAHVLQPSLSVWRVGGFKRREKGSKPLFHVASFTFEDALPALRAVARCASISDRTRVRLAVIDRGNVVLTDVAANATPLSDRFVSRQNASQQALAGDLLAGKVSTLFDQEILKEWDTETASDSADKPQHENT